MTIKLSKCHGLCLIKRTIREIKFSIDGKKILKIRERSVQRLDRYYSLLFVDCHHWKDVMKELKGGFTLPRQTGSYCQKMNYALCTLVKSRKASYQLQDWDIFCGESSGIMFIVIGNGHGDPTLWNATIYSSSSLYIYIYIYPQIALTACYLSPSSITLGRYSRLHLASAQSFCMF